MFQKCFLLFLLGQLGAATGQLILQAPPLTPQTPKSPAPPQLNKVINVPVAQKVTEVTMATSKTNSVATSEGDKQGGAQFFKGLCISTSILYKSLP